MCGITGFVDFTSTSSVEDLLAMRDSLLHRGPDSQNHTIYSEKDYVIGLGHTRLSILDTTTLGAQPMVFQQYTIILNGEIYNFNEIKEELRDLGHDFVSHSDTEVVLHAFAAWGTSCIDRFIGMFAFVVYDSIKKKTYLCRDRVGVKPMFYYWNEGLFLFASELKSFHKHPKFKKEIQPEALKPYMQFGYIPGPISIFKNVSKLEPGHWLILDLSTLHIELNRYWDVTACFKAPLWQGSYQEAKQELTLLLESACKYRMVSDVPIGVFLSGGIDSTLVTAILQNSSSESLKTFTIGFPDGKNEAPFAKEIAKYLGTDHTSYDCTEKEAKQIIPELSYYYDEPCADISTIPTILVSRLAKQRVTVALSADGGDELFAGYSGFGAFPKKINNLRSIPFPRFSAVIFEILSNTISKSRTRLYKTLSSMSSVLASEVENQYWQILKNETGIPSFFVDDVLSRDKRVTLELARDYKNSQYELADERNALFLNAFQGALKDLLLVKVDRATMSASLEGREPLLDHRLIEFSARLPFEFKHNGTTSKRILKDILYDFVPQELMDRPKMGFDLPIFSWLKNDLSFLIDTYLNEQAIKDSDCFEYSRVNEIVKEFRAGKLVYVDIIWRLIHFQQWYEKWIKNKTV